MRKSNDDRIIKLREEIQKLKNTSSRKAQYFTHCVLKLDGETYNIHTLDLEKCTYVLVKLQALRDAELKLREEYSDLLTMICGYTLDDWIMDLKQRREFIIARDKAVKLDEMERSLKQLLSEDKQTEIAIDEIEASLNSI